MKKVEFYICETCGTQYNSKEKCMLCEKSHVFPLEFGAKKYVAFTNFKGKKNYPAWIEVKFNDGNTVRYKQ